MTTATPRPVPGPPKPAPPPRTDPGRTDTAHADSGHADPVRIEEERVTGAQSLVRSLEEVGGEVVFGIPGGAILPAYDPLLDSTRVRHVLVRHEQGAGHAATGYAQATGKVGVCMATSGPGATNLVTPIADAHMDSVPMVAITGQVGRAADRHRRASRRPTSAASRCRSPSTTSWSPTPAEIPQTIASAFHLAATGRPGPVLVDIPKDVLQSQTTFVWPPDARICPGYRPTTAAARQADPRGRQADRRGAPSGALRRRRGAQGRAPPRCCAAGRADRHPGRHHADGPRRVPGLAHRSTWGCPACTAPSRRSARMQQADLLVALGARFDDRVTGQLSRSPRTRRSSTPTSTRPRSARTGVADVPIVGDARRGHRRADRRGRGRAGGRRRRRPHRLVGRARRPAGDLPARLRLAGRRLAVPAVRDRAARRDRRPGRDLRGRRRASTRCGRRSSSRTRSPRTWLNSGGSGHHGLRGAGRDGRQGGPAGRRRCGRSTATAASR